MTPERLGGGTRSRWTSLLDAAALRGADAEAPALVYLETDAEPQVVSRAQFRARARAHAKALRRAGIGPDDLVVLAHLPEVETVFAFWGALLLGAVPSIFPTLTEKLDRELYFASVAELVRHAQVKAVLTSETFAPELQARVDRVVVGLSALLDNGATDSTPDFVPASDAVAFLQHSSGTTGLQKGVALSHAAVLNQLASYSDALALDAEDVVVSWLPLYHDMGLIAGFLLPLVQGLPLVLMSPFDWVAHPALLLRAIDRYRGTLVWLPNFAYNHCARRIRRRDTEGLDLGGVRAFVNCSEPVHDESHRLFIERFAANGVRPEQLTVSYAMAENTFAVTQTPVARAPRLDVVNGQVNVSCGPPIPGASVRVLDDAGASLAERQVGELVVRSDCMFNGYYRRPDLDAGAWWQGWYRTGDMGYLAAGEVYVIGRKKDLIINGGKNVYPQDLEALASAIPGVHAGRAVAFGVYDEREGTEVVAMVAEVETPDPADRHEIEQAIRQRIVQAASVTVTHVTLVDERWLIKTSSGKIARAANRAKWLEERAGPGREGAPT
jgi:fatty-acyl-CoA synthase